MHWRQISVSIVAALTTGYLLHEQGWGPLLVGATACIVYFLVRWGIAWLYRIRYWYWRGTKGAFSRNCPDCGQYIYRRKRHWLLSCGRCGWKAGWPVVRWVTQSVPARQLRRTANGPPLAVVTLLSAFVILGSLYGIPVADDNPEVVIPNTTITEGDGQGEVQDTQASADRTSDVDDTDIDTDTTEQLILQRTNAIREKSGLSPVSDNSIPARFAAQHSRDMGVYNFYDHTGPNGTTAKKRINRISDACGGAAAENIHRAPLEPTVYIYNTTQTITPYNETQLAEYAVQGWMNSPPHRQNMLDARWNRAGVGVYVSDEEIYMTIIFC